MVDASLLAYADVTYVRHKYKDAAREKNKKGSRLELLATKKGVRVVRDSRRELYTLNRSQRRLFLDPESVEEVLDFCRQRNI